MTNALQVIESEVALPERADDLALIDLARRALAEAKTLPDIRAIRDQALALHAYAKARGLGIEAENSAAEVRVRAERMMGAELIRMGEAGERARFGPTPFPLAGKPPGHGRHRAALHSTVDGPPTLGELGVETWQNQAWQKLARLDDTSFEAVVTRAKESGGRLARLDFVRAAEDILGEDEDTEPVAKPVPHSAGAAGPPWLATWARVVADLAELQAHLDHGWPVPLDRADWTEVDQQVTTAGRSLVRFQARVRSFLNG